MAVRRSPGNVATPLECSLSLDSPVWRSRRATGTHEKMVVRIQSPDLLHRGVPILPRDHRVGALLQTAWCSNRPPALTNSPPSSNAPVPASWSPTAGDPPGRD